MKTRIAVVSPFLDKRHGTERVVAEQIERLANDYEIHLYSTAVQDVDLSKIIWHRVPALPGPHLFAYCWWFVANHLWRWWDRQFRGLAPAMVYSPGINCFDPDLISVHIVFAEFRRQVHKNLELGANPIHAWPRILHRRIYYRLITGLERLVYGGGKATLSAVSGKVARDLERYGRAEAETPVIFHGIDPERFNAGVRTQLRERARGALGLKEDEFCLLLVGNDWKKKGLPVLLECLGRVGGLCLRLLVVGQDMIEPYLKTLERLRLADLVTFLPPRRDVEFYYAAADLYVGPSLEDAFALPPLEAMACGVPAIVSRQAGVSEAVTEGVDGFVLDDPRDSGKLSELIALLCQNDGLRHRIGEAAAKTARRYTWGRNAEQLGQLFREVLRRKRVGQSVGSTKDHPGRSTAQREQLTASARELGSMAGIRIAVVSPFLDRRHGTERRVVELIERLARDYGYEIHIYSQRVQDVAGVERFQNFGAECEKSQKVTARGDASGRLLWHKLPRIPGPHLFNYLWWFTSNHLWRWWDRRFRSGKYDLVYTPGINCLDADVVSVHIIFAEFYRQVRNQLRLRANPILAWPRVIHRRLYYNLIIALEKVLYPRPSLRLAVISRKTRDDLRQIRRRDDHIPVVYGGLDRTRFSAQRRMQLRLQARQAMKLADTAFALLLVGNDWKKKGLDGLLIAIGRLQDPHVWLLVAGQDSVEPYRSLIDHNGLGKQLIFLPNRLDVEFYYAAADAYVCPSLEDAFAYPPFEAMACGLPVIASSQAGVSELITDGVDGFILDDPRDSRKLANLIALLQHNEDLRRKMGEAAGKTAQQYSWDRNARELGRVFEEVLQRKLCPRVGIPVEQDVR